MGKHLQVVGLTTDGNIAVFDSNGFAVDSGISASSINDTNIFDIVTANYTILSGQYILNITVSSTLTLPLISSLYIGKVFRIFNGNFQSILNTSGSNIINGINSGILNPYDMITIRAISANNWRIGD